MTDQGAGDPGRGDRRAVRTAEVAGVAALLSILLAEVFYLLVLHEGPRYPAVAERTETLAEPSNEPTPEDPPDDEQADRSEVGETRIGGNTDTTLLQIRRIRPPAAFAPPAGREWFGIRARICLHPNARPSGGLPWSSWAVTDSRGKRYLGSPPPWDDYPAQQLQSTGIQPGRCNLGWVLIDVPERAGRRVETVLFRPKAATPAEWAV